MNRSASSERLRARANLPFWREASARPSRGAKIIFWSETAAYLPKQDEPDLLARGRALASKYRIYLGLTLGTWTPKAQCPLENKIVSSTLKLRLPGNTSNRARHPAQKLRCRCSQTVDFANSICLTAG
jgi:hypothetical protein